MKQKKHFLMAVLIALPLIFVACSDDDDDNGNGSMRSHFTYDGATFDLDHGFMFNFGQWWGDGYSFDVSLHSDGIEFSVDFMEATGEGHGMFFEMYSPDEESLTPGTYVYDDDDEGDPFTFYMADIIMNWDSETDEGTEVVIVGGSVEVDRSGSTYTLRVDAIGEGGKEITGYFNGPLPVYDMEDFWKSTEKPRPF